MIDYYVVATPFLLLGVIALVGFVGCNQFFGLEETEPIPPPDPPINFTAMAGNKEVVLDWFVAPDVTQFHLFRGTMTGNVVADYPSQRLVQLNEIPFHDTDVVNRTQYFYRVTAVNSAGESDLSDEAFATPIASGQFTPFVDQPPVLGTLHNQDAGFFGMKIVVGSAPINVEQLGRYFIPGNGKIHEMRIVDAATQMMVPNSQVFVDITKGSSNDFVYETVTGPVQLTPGRAYYIVSVEQIGMDEYYLDDTAVHTTGVASVPSAASGDGTNFTTTGGMNNTYGPVSFSYS